MSVPKSPIYKCTRGFLANTDVKVNSPSPSSSHSQNVNVLVYPDLNQNPYAEAEKLAHYTPADAQTTTPTTNSEEKPTIQERSVETAENTLTTLQKLNSDKDQVINALSQLLDIYEHNPLIVNKYVIADDEVLSNLIQALTNADEVTIYKQDYEPKCFEKKVSFSVISKIIIKIGDTIYNLKYNFPNVVEFLEEHHISIKFVY